MNPKGIYDYDKNIVDALFCSFIRSVEKEGYGAFYWAIESVSAKDLLYEDGSHLPPEIINDLVANRILKFDYTPDEARLTLSDRAFVDLVPYG